jgi:hypothetical protein
MTKAVHQFECRDDLWQRVEALARRRGISADEVVQAALLQLFSRKKGDDAPAAGPTPAPAPATTAAPSRPPPPARAAAPARPAPTPSASRPAAAPGSRLPPPGGRAAAPAVAPARAKARPLYLFCEGQWYTIDKEQFVIGRGSKYSDLPIKDANISRRHCAVVRRDGGYFIKDLGSTNGIEFNGERVDDHPIEEGNVYFLCDHELRFTFEHP